MRAVRSVDGGVAVVEVDEPPGSGALVDVRSASICGSDLGYIQFGCRSILGHEVAGVLEDGTPVALEAMFGCTACAQCDRGAINLCPTHTQRALGVNADGGMADFYRAPAERLVPLPDGLDLADASLVEPSAVSWHALRLGDVESGKTVAVVGAGALGLLAVAGARAQGATEVALEARHPHQQAAGERLGAGIGASAQAGTYDVVVEAAGTPQSLAHAIDLAAPGGTVVVLGVHMGTVELDWHKLFLREIRVVPSIGYGSDGARRDMDEAAAMLARDPEIARTLITHRFPLDDAVDAFRVAGDRASGAIRVVLEP